MILSSLENWVVLEGKDHWRWKRSLSDGLPPDYDLNDFALMAFHIGSCALAPNFAFDSSTMEFSPAPHHDELTSPGVISLLNYNCHLM